MRLDEFLKDPATGVWRAPDTTQFNYSDGKASEEYLDQVLEQAVNRSSISSELAAKIIDWPSRYHLSPLRANLLRPISQLDKTKRVLEIGAGCGAITRYLGETCGRVDAVEGSLPRAAIARKRCRDLSNVQVYQHNFNHLQLDSIYDVVTLIGVLEYAPLYLSEDFGQRQDACAKMLSLATTALKDDGILVLALENKLGVKYWSGCSEDHTGRFFESLYDYPNPLEPGPFTFDKRGLEDLLRKTGFESCEFYYPFPDYKMPNTIFRGTDAELMNFRLHNWIQTPFEDYVNPRNYSLQENLLVRTLNRAGMLASFSNSFLVVASKRDLGTRPKWLAKRYSVERSASFATETTLLQAEKKITKHRLFPELPQHTDLQNHDLMENWVDGDLLAYDFYAAVFNNESDPRVFGAVLRKYHEKLLKNYGAGTSDDQGYPFLKQDALDYTPWNIIPIADHWHYIDNEWTISFPATGEYLLFRFLYYLTKTQRRFLFAKGVVGDDVKASLLQRIREIYPAYDERRLEKNRQMEEQLQAVVHGRFQALTFDPVESLSDLDAQSQNRIIKRIKSENQQLMGRVAETDELKQELARVQSIAQEQQQALQVITSARAYKLLKKYYGFRDRLLPQGSHLRKAVKYLWKSLLVFRKHGFRELLRKAKAKIVRKVTSEILREQAGAADLRLSKRLARKIKHHYYKQIGKLLAHQPVPAALPVHRFAPATGDVYVPYVKAPAKDDLPIRLIAFFLPQFHPIPENDAWWGEGFTEWTNVKPAIPLFEGHYQPHVPDELGYYHLLDSQIQKRQVELAREYGVGGFCFYFYWFNGKRLLEQPLLNYLQDKSLSLPFCLCWANENWTRRWDGKEKEVLVSQKHSPEDDLAFIQYVSQYLRDPRYVRVAGKPLLVVYRPSLFPEMKATLHRWRQWCRDNGVGELYLAYTQSFDKVDPSHYGFDAAVEFPPNNMEQAYITHDIKPLVRDFAPVIFDWPVNVERSRQYQQPTYKLFRGVFPSWDNTARRKNKATIFVNNSPARFKEWLWHAFEDTFSRFSNKDERLVFVNAWNEWAEGAHLEPDQKYGFAWLQAVRDAFGRFGSGGINYTNRENPEIAAHKQREAAYLFGLEGQDPQLEWLADYLAFFRSLKEKCAVAFESIEGIPNVKTETKNILLDNRSSISHLYTALFPVKDPIITFVLLQYNKVELTEACVNSIFGLHDHRVRVVIVDNGSHAQAQELTKQKFSGKSAITLIFNQENLGFAKGNNIGYRYAREVLKSHYILVINNDTIIEDPAFLQKSEKLFEAWGYSILGPDIVIPDGRHENPWNDYIYSRTDWEAMQVLYTKQKEDYIKTGHPEFRRLGKVSQQRNYILNPILQGAAFILSSIFVMNNENLFDERLFLYGEELLLSMKALVEGELLLYSCDLSIKHMEGVSTGQFDEHKKMMTGYENINLALTYVREEYERAYPGGIRMRDKHDPDLSVHTKRIKILVDLLFCQPGYHGGGEYGKAIFKALAEKIRFDKINREKYALFAALNKDLFIDPWVYDLCRFYGIEIIDVKSYDDIIALVNRDIFEAFFAPAIVVYTGYEYMKVIGKELKLAPKRTRIIAGLLDIRDYEIACQHEAIHAHWKKMGANDKNNTTGNFLGNASAKLKAMYEKICGSKHIDHLVTLTQYTKNSIVQNLGIPEDKVQVFYPPMKASVRPMPFDLGVRGKFALILNADRFEKNGPAAIRAMDELFEEGKLPEEIVVVVTGIGQLDRLGMKIKHASQFKAMGYLAPEELEYLYQQASFLLFTSLNEGFGYPPIEIMKYQKPSVVSNVTSLPEVCGSSSVYCDPYDVVSIKKAILTVMADPPARESLKRDYEAIKSKQAADLRGLVNLILDRAHASVDLLTETGSQ